MVPKFFVFLGVTAVAKIIPLLRTHVLSEMHKHMLER